MVPRLCGHRDPFVLFTSFRMMGSRLERLCYCMLRFLSWGPFLIALHEDRAGVRPQDTLRDSVSPYHIPTKIV